MGLDVCSSPRDPPNEVQKERGMLCLQGCQLREFLCNFEGKRGQTLDTLQRLWIFSHRSALGRRRGVEELG